MYQDIYNGEAGDLRCQRSHYDVIVMVEFVLVGYLGILPHYLKGWDRCLQLSNLFEI